MRRALLLCLLLCSPCFGQDYDVRAVVSVIQHSGSGGNPTACGTLVASENGVGLVVTVAHVFEGNLGRTVQWQDGSGTQASLIGIDQQMDVAAVLVSNPPADIRPIPLAGESEYPQANDTAKFIGHGGGNWRHFEVKVLGYEHKREESYNSQLRLGFRPISGDSGGPIIYKGKLVGVQWGGPAHQGDPIAYESHATYCGVIENRLTQWRRQYPQCPGNYCQQPAAQQPVPSRPQQPPAVPSVPPQGGAAGCQCKGTVACKCDPKAKACACDSSKVASLELRICQLEQLIESGKLKGEKGDKGDAGPQGIAGPTGPQGKACDVVSAPVEIIRPDGTKKQLLWPLDGKHGLRLPLNMK